MPELNDLNADSPAKLSRRNVVVGTAWALPVVMGVGAASAVAASTVLTVTLSASAQGSNSKKTKLSCTVGVGSSPGTGAASLGDITPGTWPTWTPPSAWIKSGSATFKLVNADPTPNDTSYSFQVTAGGVTKTATFVFSAYGTQTVTLS